MKDRILKTLRRWLDGEPRTYSQPVLYADFMEKFWEREPQPPIAWSVLDPNEKWETEKPSEPEENS